jgi:hypothetical protein
MGQRILIGVTVVFCLAAVVAAVAGVIFLGTR